MLLRPHCEDEEGEVNNLSQFTQSKWWSSSEHRQADSTAHTVSLCDSLEAKLHLIRAHQQLAQVQLL